MKTTKFLKTHSNKFEYIYILFSKFSGFTRVTVIYKQAGKVAIDSEGKSWKDYDVGKLN